MPYSCPAATAKAAPPVKRRRTLVGYNFEIVHVFEGQGKMDLAEDWIRANIRGLWAVEFLGMEQKNDPKDQNTIYQFHVRFMFGRQEDLKRFKLEYLQGKKPAQGARPGAKPVRKKGFFARLFSR